MTPKAFFYSNLVMQASSLTLLKGFLSDIKCWMSNNFLQINNSLLFGPPNSIRLLGSYLTIFLPHTKPAAGVLGMMFDSDLCFDV